MVVATAPRVGMRPYAVSRGGSSIFAAPGGCGEEKDSIVADEPKVTAQAFDVLFKLYGELLSDALPQRFGIHLPPVVRPFPTELPRLELRTERLDDLFELRDASLLHPE